MFGAITQPFIKKKMTKNNTNVLELLIFHETRAKKPNKSFIMLSCVIYTITDNYVCIDDLSFQ